MNRRNDLTRPRQPRRLSVHYDQDAFGQFSESIARTLGTARFLVWQTIVIIAWILYNLVAPDAAQFDPWDRGLVLLTLVLSLQASYAAPLILLAQNRQEQRDRVQADNDRRVAERTQFDTEFLAREIAGIRLSLADVATASDVGDHLERLTDAIERMSARLDVLEAQLAKTGTDGEPADDRAAGIEDRLEDPLDAR